MKAILQVFQHGLVVADIDKKKSHEKDTHRKMISFLKDDEAHGG